MEHDDWREDAAADARWEARQEYAQDLAEERAARRAQRCQCHGEGWPGHCPGPAACPCAALDDEEDGEDS